MSVISRLPLTTLRAFETAARLGSFSAAATELHVTPAAISHRIKTLETETRVALFERRARGVTLTEAGERYRARIAEAFGLIAAATRELGEPGIDGPLRVSAPHAFLRHTLLPRLEGLSRRHPGLALDLVGDNRLANLHTGEADVALRFGTGRYPGLRAEPLMDDAITVLAPAGEAASDDWRRAVFIEDGSATDVEPWSGWAPWWREAGLHDPAAPRRLTVSDSGLALDACRQGLGLCLARLSVAREALRRGEVVTRRPWRRTEFSHYLVSLPGNAEAPRVRAFGDWLHLALEDLADDIRLAVASR